YPRRLALALPRVDVSERVRRRHVRCRRLRARANRPERGRCDGRRQRAELFAADRLGDAVARLYERYAELLPDGPACARAAAPARAVAAMLVSLDEESRASALASDVEFADHRLLGFGSGRGAQYFLGGVRALLDTTDDLAQQIDDILGLRSDALLVRRTTAGTHRAGGGAFEIQLIQLWVFGADGLLTREERFDADHDEEALARFDELTGESPGTPSRAAERPVRRRVRADGATAHPARMAA